MSNLSNREKKLLSVMVVLAVVLVGYVYIISPLMDKNAALKEEISAQELERDKLLMEIEMGSNIDEVYENNLIENAELKKSFSPYLEDYELDNLMTDLATRSGVIPLSLEFVEAPEATTTTEETEEGTTGEVSEGEMIESESASIVSSYVSMQVMGSNEECSAFINSILSKKYMVIESLSIGYDGATGGNISILVRIDTLGV